MEGLALAVLPISLCLYWGSETAKDHRSGV